MTVSNPYYEGVKVNPTATRCVREMVKNGFYQRNKEEQLNEFKRFAEILCEEYGIKEPTIDINKFSSNKYHPRNNRIVITKGSWMSFLHEFRHHLQFEAGTQYYDHDKEEDARAWSMRVFKLACPGSFKRSVKRGDILHIKWDAETEAVVNAPGNNC